MYGKVRKIVSGDGINEATVEFSVKQYFKGCGDRNVIVTGFQGSSLCGSGVPRENDVMILFVCMDNPINKQMTNSIQKWKINNFSISTGALFLKYNPDNLYKVSELVSNKPKGFHDCSTMGFCSNGKSPVKSSGSNDSDDSDDSNDSNDSDDLEDLEDLDDLDDFENWKDDLEDFDDFDDLKDFNNFDYQGFNH